MDIENLKVLIKKVAELREVQQSCIRMKNSAQIDLDQSLEGKRFAMAIERVKEYSIQLETAEAELKAAAVALYQETKEKKPIDKVEVKITTELEYEDDKILAWCKDNAPTLLIVNKKPFEKTAVNIGAPVKVNEIPKCYIGSDLSQYLEDKKEDFEVFLPEEVQGTEILRKERRGIK